MTAFLNSITHILQIKNFGLPEINMPSIPPYMNEASIHVKKITILPISPKEIPSYESEYWIELAKAANQNNSFEEISASNLKKISQCLWYGETKLALNDNFLKSFLGACSKKIKRSLCGTLIWAYLYNYKSDNLGTITLGQWLSTTVTNWEWIWGKLHKDLNLFMPSIAHKNLSNILIKDERSSLSSLANIGINETLRVSGITKAIFIEMLHSYKNSVATLPAEESYRILKKIIEFSELGTTRFQFDSNKKDFIESLLLPWENAIPTDEIQNTTQSILIDLFNDPRMGGASWLNIDTPALRIIKSWLIKRALAQFLDVVDEMALDHQWKYRRAFWMSYYNKGAISDAWVAFSSNGSNKAKQIAKRYNDKSWLNFGNLLGSGDPDHAVLILKIGDITIADFSHNGKCRIWRSNNHNSPNHYEKNYDRSDILSAADWEYIHSGSPNYLWQNRVSTQIAQITGIRLLQRDFIA